MAAALLVVVTACSDDGGSSAVTSAAPATTSGPTPTTEPVACEDLADEYLDTFFALGAGTPEDPAATTVDLPIGQLRAIDEEAASLGCRRWAEVACSAYAELEAQGLEARNGQPPAAC